MASIELNNTFPHKYTYEAEAELSGTPQGTLVLYYPGAKTEGGSDGLIVRVMPFSSDPWIGVFGFGVLAAYSGKTGVYTCPKDTDICVVSRGVGYIVSVANPKHFEQVKTEMIFKVYPIKEQGLLIFATPWKLYAHGTDGLVWETIRLVIEGFQIMEITPDYMRGLSDDGEIAFKVDLRTGKVKR